MAKKNVTIGGTDYTQVDKVKLKETGTENYIEYVETSDTNATAGDIKAAKTAVVQGIKLTGTMLAGLPAPSCDIYFSSGRFYFEFKLTNCDPTRYYAVLGYIYFFDVNCSLNLPLNQFLTGSSSYTFYDTAGSPGGVDASIYVVEATRVNTSSHSTYEYPIIGANYYTSSWTCYLKNTSITLCDNSTKLVQDITYDDNLLVWDFDNAQFISAKPLWIKQEEKTTEYTKLIFDDKTTLSLVGTPNKKHRIFDYDLGEFIPACQFKIGHKTFNHEGELIALVKKEDIKEEVSFYNIITNYHMNLFANSILTSCGYNNIYPIQNMKFIKDNREIVPIEAYGDIDKKWYDGLRLGEQDLSKRSIEKAHSYIACRELKDVNRNK